MTRARAGRAARLRMADRLLVEKLSHPTFTRRDPLMPSIPIEPDQVTARRRRILGLALNGRDDG